MQAIEQKQIRRAMKRWPCGLIRAARRTKAGECEQTAQIVRATMLLDGLHARIPDLMLPTTSSEQKVTQQELKSLQQRNFSPNSDDKLSSSSSVSSYLGIKLKLKRIEETHDLSGASESIGAAITTEPTHTRYRNMSTWQVSRLDQPVRP